MLKIENLNINLDSFYLNNINIHISKGETLVILGHSGSGKTVFLETLSGRYKVKSGNIFLDNKCITNSLPEDRNISIVYQQYELFPFLNVYENIAFPLKRGNFAKKNYDKDVLEVMERLKISHLKDRSIDKLSGGEKQRIALARSIIINPKLLLLDEPMAALDSANKDRAMDLIKEIKQNYNLTMIYVTHDLDEALNFGDKIVIIKNNSFYKLINKKDFPNINKEEIKNEYL